MRGLPSKKTSCSHTGVRWPFCPERIFNKIGRALHSRSLAGTARHSYRVRRSRRRHSHMEKPPKMVRTRRLK